MLITWQSQPTKGSSSQATLDKTDLFNIGIVSGDAYFSVQANVAKVRVIYKSTSGDQQKILDFNLSEGTPQASASFSSTSRSNYDVIKIILQDYDDGDLVVQGSDIPSGLSITVS